MPGSPGEIYLPLKSMGLSKNSGGRGRRPPGPKYDFGGVSWEGPLEEFKRQGDRPAPCGFWLEYSEAPGASVEFVALYPPFRPGRAGFFWRFGVNFPLRK